MFYNEKFIRRLLPIFVRFQPVFNRLPNFCNWNQRRFKQINNFRRMYCSLTVAKSHGEYEQIF